MGLAVERAGPLTFREWGSAVRGEESHPAIPTPTSPPRRRGPMPETQPQSPDSVGSSPAWTPACAGEERKWAEGRIVCNPLRFGDVVLARKDSPTSYHLAVTVDDALQGVTLVTRGADLLPATDIHRLLQTLLVLPEPDYRHHALLLGPDGKRFAKRDRSVSVPDLRAAGRSAADVLAMAEALVPTGQS
ncbi:MAG: hypothetical protein KDC18_17595 [Alphaproteobacteria bacterium]|nr:hypothetical protein [Alphaproteobacteria bacterium]MCB9930709.1 hypothetical protein [Alphaproteobacteria bacterium]